MQCVGGAGAGRGRSARGSALVVRLLGAAVLRGAVVRQCGGDARVARRERLYLQSGTGDDGSGRYPQDDPAPYERL